MPHTKSAMKRMRQARKRYERNRAVRSATRTFIKKARAAIAANPAEAREQVIAAIRALDKAAQKGVIHRNNAARRKSRLMRLFNKSLKSLAEQSAQ
jgi:small subunit ribosomal protein S20